MSHEDKDGHVHDTSYVGQLSRSELVENEHVKDDADVKQFVSRLSISSNHIPSSAQSNIATCSTIKFEPDAYDEVKEDKALSSGSHLVPMLCVQNLHIDSNCNASCMTSDSQSPSSSLKEVSHPDNWIIMNGFSNTNHSAPSEDTKTLLINSYHGDHPVSEQAVLKEDKTEIRVALHEPAKREKRSAAKSARYRLKLNQDPQRMVLHRQQDRERKRKQYRVMSEEQILKHKERCKRNQKAYRDRKRQNGFSETTGDIHRPSAHQDEKQSGISEMTGDIHRPSTYQDKKQSGISEMTGDIHRPSTYQDKKQSGISETTGDIHRPSTYQDKKQSGISETTGDIHRPSTCQEKQELEDKKRKHAEYMREWRKNMSHQKRLAVNKKRMARHYAARTASNPPAAPRIPASLLQPSTPPSACSSSPPSSTPCAEPQQQPYIAHDSHFPNPYPSSSFHQDQQFTNFALKKATEHLKKAFEQGFKAATILEGLIKRADPESAMHFDSLHMNAVTPEKKDSPMLRDYHQNVKRKRSKEAGRCCQKTSSGFFE